ncbi:hypothetical protein PH31N_02464 [Cutibacterium modestum 31N]|nr:hypothetical protein [Cutibacterium modestum 31N]
MSPLIFRRASSMTILKLVTTSPMDATQNSASKIPTTRLWNPRFMATKHMTMTESMIPTNTTG